MKTETTSDYSFNFPQLLAGCFRYERQSVAREDSRRWTWALWTHAHGFSRGEKYHGTWKCNKHFKSTCHHLCPPQELSCVSVCSTAVFTPGSPAHLGHITALGGIPALSPTSCLPRASLGVLTCREKMTDLTGGGAVPGGVCSPTVSVCLSNCRLSILHFVLEYNQLTMLW